eukprot:1802882-Pyramimonas_sp.AAC.1
MSLAYVCRVVGADEVRRVAGLREHGAGRAGCFGVGDIARGERGAIPRAGHGDQPAHHLRVPHHQRYALLTRLEWLTRAGMHMAV